MGFLLLTLAAKQVQESEVTEYLLVPDLAPEQLYSPLYDVVALAAFERLKRERPYVSAFLYEHDPKSRLKHENSDYQYIQSLPKSVMLGPSGLISGIYIGQRDISPFMLNAEEDFLLFLPEPPASVIPSWPDFVTKLNGVMVSQCDEFIKLQTVDRQLMTLIEGLPKFRGI